MSLEFYNRIRFDKNEEDLYNIVYLFLYCYNMSVNLNTLKEDVSKLAAKINLPLQSSQKEITQIIQEGWHTKIDNDISVDELKIQLNQIIRHRIYNTTLLFLTEHGLSIQWPQEWTYHISELNRWEDTKDGKRWIYALQTKFLIKDPFPEGTSLSMRYYVSQLRTWGFQDFQNDINYPNNKFINSELNNLKNSYPSDTQRWFKEREYVSPNICNISSFMTYNWIWNILSHTLSKDFKNLPPLVNYIPNDNYFSNIKSYTNNWGEEVWKIISDYESAHLLSLRNLGIDTLSNQTKYKLSDTMWYIEDWLPQEDVIFFNDLIRKISLIENQLTKLKEDEKSEREAKSAVKSVLHQNADLYDSLEENNKLLFDYISARISSWEPSYKGWINASDINIEEWVFAFVEGSDDLGDWKVWIEYWNIIKVRFQWKMQESSRFIYRPKMGSDWYLDSYFKQIKILSVTKEKDKIIVMIECVSSSWINKSFEFEFLQEEHLLFDYSEIEIKVSKVINKLLGREKEYVKNSYMSLTISSVWFEQTVVRSSYSPSLIDKYIDINTWNAFFIIKSQINNEYSLVRKFEYCYYLMQPDGKTEVLYTEDLDEWCESTLQITPISSQAYKILKSSI